MNNQTAAMLVSLPFLWEWRSFHMWLLAPLQKSAYSKPSIMKMQISEKWRKLSVNQEIPCVYPFPGYCSCSDTRNICLNLIRISMWLFAFKRFKIEKSSMIFVDFVVNVSTHLFKTNFYILKVSWCSNRSMKYERNQCVNGLFTFCRGL